jgi:uncharacterized small protein (DUF1192 family)
MIEDEEVRAADKSRLEILPLDPLSVADLQSYISALRAEILRVEAVIEKKNGARGLADSFFTKP